MRLARAYLALRVVIYGDIRFIGGNRGERPIVRFPSRFYPASLPFDNRWM
jgi:hypothetical protein